MEKTHLNNYQLDFLERVSIQIASFSNINRVSIPSTLYHASPNKNIETFEPERGQGIGTWAMKDLKDAAHFAFFRSVDPWTNQKYVGSEPTVYELKSKFNKLAIFPTEISLYNFCIDLDAFDDRKIGANIAFEDIRESLKDWGYDGVHLIEEDTYAALYGDNLEIVRAYDVQEHFYEEFKSELARRFPKDPFSPYL